MLSVDQFARGVRAGRIGLNPQGGLTVVGQHRGRQVAQAGAAANREVVQNEARENRIVIGKFIDAIAADQRYGQGAAQAARLELHDEIRDGIPLDERLVNRAMVSVVEHIHDRVVANHALAERFSDPLGDHQGAAPNINSELSRLWKTDSNEPLPRLDPDSFFAHQALTSIKADILALGNGGMHEVTEQEARQIAEPHLASLAEQTALDEMLEASVLDAVDKAQLRRLILADPTLNKHNIAYEANSMRLENHLDISGSIKVLPAVSDAPDDVKRYAPELEQGIFAAKHKLAHKTAKSLQQNILGAGQLRAGLNDKVQEHIAVRQRLAQHVRGERNVGFREALTKAIYADPSIESERDVDNLVARKRALLEHIEGHHIEEPERKMLRTMVLTDRSLNTPDDVDRIVAARQACRHLGEQATELADGNDQSNAYVSYRNSLGELSLQDGLRGMTLVGAEARARFDDEGGEATAADDAAHPAGWRHGAQTSREPGHAELRATWHKLTDQKAQELKSGVQWLAEQHGNVPGVRQLGEEFYQFSTEMPKNLAAQIDLHPRERAYAVDTPLAIVGEQDVPDTAYNVFRDFNVPVPLPNPVGRSQENTALGERFNARLLEGVSERASAGGEDIVNGMAGPMHREFGQAKFSVNKAWDAQPSLEGDIAQREVSDFFGDDDQGRLAVSYIANPSLFTEFATATAAGDGPFSLAPLTADDPAQTQRSYSLHRASNGHYLVGGSERKPVEALVNPSDGSVVATDPAQSYVDYHVRMAVDTRGREKAPPRVRLVGPATCSYKFVPQEQEPSAQEPSAQEPSAQEQE